MNRKGKQLLGLAVQAESIVACQLQWNGNGSPRVERSAVFALPEGESFNTPDAIAQPFAAFLAEHGFTARRAVVGLPAAWLAVRERTVPQADDARTLEMITLLAEREFATDARDLAIECALDSASMQPQPTSADDAADESPMRPVLLLATMRKRIDAVRSIVEAAHVRIEAITCSAVALAHALNNEPGAWLLHITPQAVELVYRDPAGAKVGTVRHLATHGPGDNGGDTPWAQTLAGELRRLSMNIPQGDGPLLINDTAGLSSTVLDALATRMDVTRRVIQRVGAAALGDDKHHATAMAVALAGANGERPWIDFLHSRLTPTELRIPAMWRMIAAAAAIILIAALTLTIDMTMTNRDIRAMQQELTQLKGRAGAAAELRDRVRFARNWYDDRPLVRDWLLALTETFPERGTVWASALTLENDMSATLTGQAESYRHVEEVLDAMEASPFLGSPRWIGMRAADRQSRNMAFTIHFNYLSHVRMDHTARQDADENATDLTQPVTATADSPQNGHDKDEHSEHDQDDADSLGQSEGQTR